jgi:Fe-S-cluster containining protein
MGTIAMTKFPGETLLKFRCTGCGNCCKEPLLPVTAEDVRRIATQTGDEPADVVRWVDRHGIDMDDEPEAFVRLAQGKRVMILRHRSGGAGCRYLGDDNRCTIYSSRPLGCRVYPFDPEFTAKGKLRRLRLVRATECPYETDGDNDVDALRDLHERYTAAHERYNERVAEWNAIQEARRRRGKSAQTSREFLAFLGLETARNAPAITPSTG